jgi:hypothetical protein
MNWIFGTFPRTAVPYFCLLLFAFALITVQSYEFDARVYPMAVAVVGLCLSVLELLVPHVSVLRQRLTPTSMMDLELDGSLSKEQIGQQAWMIFRWFFLFIGGIMLFGFHVAVAVFMVAWMRLKGEASWLGTAIATGVVWAILFIVLDRTMIIPWPEPLLLRWLGL